MLSISCQGLRSVSLVLNTGPEPCAKSASLMLGTVVAHEALL